MNTKKPSTQKRTTRAKQKDRGASAPSSTGIDEGLWTGFVPAAAEQLFLRGGSSPEDLRRFGAYIRGLRYRSGTGIPDVAAAARLPAEQLALLEQGLLEPSAITPETWVRLMSVLDSQEKPAPAATASGTHPGRPAESDALPSTDADQQREERAAVPSPKAGQRTGGPMDRNIGVARIKVIGVGGGGSNAVSRMFRQQVPGVEYAVVNTDSQHLLHIDVPVKLRIGDQLTRGLGVGGDPEVGRGAALESRGQLEELVADTDMVFIACGMGGGTGTGAAPVVAELAKAAGALTIAAVTKPFAFEGRRRMRQAENGIARLRDHVDTLLITPNDRLSAVDGGEITAENAFRLADDVLRQGVQSITELIAIPGEINLDFADVKTVMHGSGPAWMAIGYGRGTNRAEDAAKAALESPLLDIPVEGATRVLVNIAGGADTTLHEVHRAADYVSRLVDPEANIIFGMVTDTRLDDEIRVTVIATGIRDNEELFNAEAARIEAELQAEVEPEEPAEDRANGAGPGEERPSFWRRLGFGRGKPEE